MWKEPRAIQELREKKNQHGVEKLAFRFLFFPSTMVGFCCVEEHSRTSYMSEDFRRLAEIKASVGQL